MQTTKKYNQLGSSIESLLYDTSYSFYYICIFVHVAYFSPYKSCRVNVLMIELIKRYDLSFIITE